MTVLRRNFAKTIHEDDHMMPGNKNAPKCRIVWAMMEFPVGVLEGREPGGKVYLIVAPAGGYAEFMAQEIRVEGYEAYPGASILSEIWVKEYDKWVEKVDQIVASAFFFAE